MSDGDKKKRWGLIYATIRKSSRDMADFDYLNQLSEEELDRMKERDLKDLKLNKQQLDMLKNRFAGCMEEKCDGVSRSRGRVVEESWICWLRGKVFSWCGG